MLLNKGKFDNQQILSEASVAALVQKQTPPNLKDNYGLGFSVGPTNFGHGGAYSTNSSADSKTGLILVWLVQHNGFPGEGGKAKKPSARKPIFNLAPTKNNGHSPLYTPSRLWLLENQLAYLG